MRFGRLDDPWFDASFISRTTKTGHYRQGGQIDGADGVIFFSPCGGHYVMVSFANPCNAPCVPADAGTVNRSGQPSRWQMAGTGLHDLTLSPSVDLTDPQPTDLVKLKTWHSCWHGHVTGGIVS